MEDDIQKKQKFLKEEILDKNYDQERFMQFCLQKKENGDDLTSWTMDELVQIVKDFSKIQNTEKEEKKESINSDNMMEEEQNIDDDINKIKMNVPLPNKSSLKTIKISCKKYEETPLSNKKVKVIIQNPKSVETGVFSSNYVMYEVITKDLNWMVKRRYSDFLWLRTVLAKFAPGYVIPPLPNKKIGSRNLEADFIKKRMVFLQKFIDAVIQNETFKSCEPLISFLSIHERSQFEHKKDEFSSYIPSPFIEEYRTLTGTILIPNDDEEENEKYFVNISNYFRIQKQLYERLNFNLKDFYNNLNLVCLNLVDIQKDFETLNLLNKKVLMKEEVTKSFEEFGNFVKNWERVFDKQNEIIKVCFKEFFKFIKMEGIAYEELIRSRNEIKYKYTIEKDKLYAKKEKLWQGKDISKWEIEDDFKKVDQTLLKEDKRYALSKMCTKETNNLDYLQKQLRFTNRMNMEQLKNMIKSNSNKFLENIKDFSDQFYPTLTDLINVFSSLMIFFHTYYDKKHNLD